MHQPSRPPATSMPPATPSLGDSTVLLSSRAQVVLPSLLEAKAHWLETVDDLIAQHRIAERVLLHELLLLLRYLPLHLQAMPETVNLLDDLLQRGPNPSKPPSTASSPMDEGLFALFAGRETSARTTHLMNLQHIRAPPHHSSIPPSL